MSNTPSANPSKFLIHTSIFVCVYLSHRTVVLMQGTTKSLLENTVIWTSWPRLSWCTQKIIIIFQWRRIFFSWPAATVCFCSIIHQSLVVWATMSLGCQCPKSELSRCFMVTAAMDRLQLGGHMWPAELEENINSIRKKIAPFCHFSMWKESFQWNVTQQRTLEILFVLVCKASFLHILQNFIFFYKVGHLDFPCSCSGF